MKQCAVNYLIESNKDVHFLILYILALGRKCTEGVLMCRIHVAGVTAAASQRTCAEPRPLLHIHVRRSRGSPASGLLSLQLRS